MFNVVLKIEKNMYTCEGHHLQTLFNKHYCKKGQNKKKMDTIKVNRYNKNESRPFARYSVCFFLFYLIFLL